MTPVGRYERVMKDLDMLIRYARGAATFRESLDDKVATQQLVRELEETRTVLRRNIYEMQDVQTALRGKEATANG